MVDTLQTDAVSEEFATVRVLNMMGGYCLPQTVYCAVSLGIPDLLKQRPLPVERIAAGCGCEASRLTVLLRAPSAIGVFRQSQGPML
jgi:hypothetical protein